MREIGRSSQQSRSVVKLPVHDFPAKQVIFHSHLLSDQVPKQVIGKLNKTNKLRLYTGKAKFESYLSGEQVGSWKFFLSPDNDQTGNNQGIHLV